MWKTFPFGYFRLLFLRKNIILCSYSARLPHLTSCTRTKCNLNLSNSLATVESDPDLYRLLTFHVPNLMSLLHSLGRTKRLVQAHASISLQGQFFLLWVISTSPNPQAGEPPLVGCPRLPIEHIRSCPTYGCRSSIRLPEDSPFRGDRDPLIMALYRI